MRAAYHSIDRRGEQIQHTQQPQTHTEHTLTRDNKWFLLHTCLVNEETTTKPKLVKLGLLLGTAGEQGQTPSTSRTPIPEILTSHSQGCWKVG
jgi:hypothetical protein